MTEELKAALERLRLQLPHGYQTLVQLRLDMAELAYAYYAEHPADDGDEVRPEWIVSLLPPLEELGWSADHVGRFGSIDWQKSRTKLLLVWVNGRQLDWEDMTKGEFRRLCLGLGVKTTEGGAG